MENPLERLVVSAEELDKELLATALAGLLTIDRPSGAIRFTARAVKLSKKSQILIYLLGRKAAKAMNLIGEEGITPREMEDQLGIKGGSLRGQLSQMKQARLITSHDGKYAVPNYGVEAVKELLTGNKEEI